jgi:hypothetical protein
MALCIIVIQDSSEGNGLVDVQIRSEPSVDIKHNENNTPAQTLAAMAVRTIMKETGQLEPEESKEDFEASFGEEGFGEEGFDVEVQDLD